MQWTSIFKKRNKLPPRSIISFPIISLRISKKQISINKYTIYFMLLSCSITRYVQSLIPHLRWGDKHQDTNRSCSNGGHLPNVSNSQELPSCNGEAASVNNLAWSNTASTCSYTATGSCTCRHDTFSCRQATLQALFKRIMWLLLMVSVSFH